MIFKTIEFTGIWTLALIGFADVEMSWIAAVLASAVSLKILGVWLYGLIRKWLLR